jgi:hypothetical protein
MAGYIFFVILAFTAFFLLLICFFALWRFSLALYCFPTGDLHDFYIKYFFTAGLSTEILLQIILKTINVTHKSMPGASREEDYEA